MSADFYEPLIERDLDAIPAAARAFSREHSVNDLYLSVARFAVLAYAPSQHSKRAVMACRAAYEVREVCGDRWIDIVIECARYAAESRQPWSEPPIFEPSAEDLPSREELERDAGDDAMLMIETAFALIPILGEKGEAALIRMPQMELEAPQTRSQELPVETLVDRVIASRGSIESVQAYLVRNRGAVTAPICPPAYRLARDFADTLLAYAHAPSYRRDEFLAAVRDNLENGESYADWSFA